uniref:Zinc finger protein 658 n=1 Tax=Cacopsylla melanoneura TaxID=428564 RepID=A0A8D8RVH4_9HEMI
MEISKREEIEHGISSDECTIEINNDTDVKKEEMDSKDDLSTNNESTENNFAIKEEVKEELQQPNVIVVRIKKKKGAPRKADPHKLYTPELFLSMFGFSIFDCQDSEWRQVLRKRQGVLHFRSNGTRVQQPSDVDVKPLRLGLHNQRTFKKKAHPRTTKSKHVNVNFHPSKQSKRSFECLICNGLISDIDSYFKTAPNAVRKHIRTVHYKLRPFACDHCPFKFRCIAVLKKHNDAVHLKLKPYKCKTCNKAFATTTSLNVHNTSHEEKGRYECKICGKRVRHSNTFKDHMNMHTGEIKYNCNICEKTFLYKKSFKDHLLLHSSQYSSQCSICNAYFKSDTARKKHERAHLTLFQCSMCDKILSTQRSLKLHIENMHINADTGERPFKCNHCNATFRLKNNLDLHINQLHTNTLICNQCQATFPNKARLIGHINKEHAEIRPKPFKCNICGKCYYKPSHAKRHMKTHDKIVPSSFHCSECGKQYKLKILMQKHKKKCTATCKSCGKILASKQTMQKHLEKCQINKNANDSKSLRKGSKNCKRTK